MTPDAPMTDRLLALLGSRLPLVQAPMAGSQGSALAIAVSRAGGLGSLPCAMLTGDALRAELAALAAGASGPFNVNFFCNAPPVADAAREAAWRAALAPAYAQFGIDASQIAPDAGRQPFSDAIADIVQPFAPRVVSFHFGLPEPRLVARVKAWGAAVLSSATTLDEALWLQANGADAVIAQGLEAGGHRGMFLTDDLTTQTGTLALTRQLVRSLRVPVIAAGGIADAAAVAAARAAGAAGVQVGTAYLLCDEALTSEVHRAAIAAPSSRHTALTNLFTGRPARGIVNRFMREHGPISALAPAFPLATAATAPLRAAAQARGSGDYSPLWAGQDTGGCRAVPAAVVTQSLAEGWRA